MLEILFFCSLVSSVLCQQPCDIFASGSTPCVAAHSTVRSLYQNYNGALYQVRRLHDNATKDISVVSTGGYADSSSQDAFCDGSSCVIQRIYDQSPQKNHLDVAPAGGYVTHPDNPVNATRHPITIEGGNKVYGAYFEGDMGYRNDNTNGIATDNNPETLYMVTSGKHFNGGCCFDYGNAETNNADDGDATMEAIYFGNSTGWTHGAGNGPWVMADLENGLYAGNETVNNENIPITSTFVFAMVKGGSNGFSLKGGDANGNSLIILYDGPRPSGYQPMKKQGAIILGIGGDNSDSAIGSFYEGAITIGYSNDTIDTDVYNNVVAANYG